MGKKIQCIGRYTLEGHLLGKGSFARVELAHHTITGCKVAIKIIDTRKIKEESQKDKVPREAKILGQLRHPNVVRLYETLKASTLHCLVMEYASGGELQAFIKLQKDFRLSEERGRPYIRQLVSALHYLHERGVAHRDIKMENIMLDTPKKNVKLIDFGLSNTFSKDGLMKTHCGSPEYAAPELFTAGEKYGLEIDVWSLGIVIYAMLVGKLPFTTPYTDQYRRQKLVQQMEKGLVEVHNQEMGHLSADCQDLIRKVIEPSPSLRLPLLDMEIHAWITDNGKKPFFPFQSFPRDKYMKTQTLEELAVALSMKKEVLEQKVAENKSDELSAMFNMILDRKRQQQGVYDVDHTLKSTEKKETKGKRSKSAHVKYEKGEDKKQLLKGPPALVLPSDDMTLESALQTGNEQDGEAKFSTFDFLALCSTPSWLGPERRKSRRRSRSPMPSPHFQQHGSHGLSVRDQMKRDFLERQAMEMEREMIREERAALSGHLSPIQGNQQLTNHNDLHIPVNTSVSVPGNDSSSSNQLAIRRSSSFKFSRRRARSCGPSHRRKGSFQRSNSVDHNTPEKDELISFTTSIATAKEGYGVPAISSGSALFRGTTKTSSLKIRRNSKSGLITVSASRKRSVDFLDTSNKNFHGVPNFDMHLKNPSTGLSHEPQKNLLQVPEVDIVSRNLLQVPNLEMGSNPVLCVHNHDSLSAQEEDTLPVNNGLKLQSATRPGKLILKECYQPPKEEKIKPSLHLLPLVKPLISGTNGPLTSVEVHYADSCNPDSSTEILQSSSHILKTDSLKASNADIESLNDSHSQGSLHKEVSGKKSQSDSPFKAVLDHGRPSGHEKKPQKLSVLETSASSVSSQHRPISVSKSNHVSSSHHLQEGAIAMQIAGKPDMVYSSCEDRVLLGAEGPLVQCDLTSKSSLAEIHHHFHGLTIASECLEENEDNVDSMTDLISVPLRHEILNGTRNSGSIPVGLGATHKVNKQNSAPLPDDDLIQSRTSSRNDNGNVTNFSRGSVTRRYSSGKVKSPTTPTWLNLKTPLARIESFHSDDFECYAESDHDEQESASSASVTTPTVPCFAYKLHVMKKKQTKLKNNSSSKTNKCSSTQNSDNSSSKLNRNSLDKKHTSSASNQARLEAAVAESLLSSGSETEQHEESHERHGVPGKSKIHPMESDDRDAELLSKSDTKCLPYHNAITRQPYQIKNSIKIPKTIQEDEQGTKKKAFVKNLAWRKSFAQFLKRKRYHSPAVTSTSQQQQIHQNQQPQQTQTSPGNNNNNDVAHTDPVPESRNGTSAFGQQHTKVLDISTGTEDLLLTSQTGDSIKVLTATLSSVPVENTTTELTELQSSPKLHCSSSPSRVFEFGLATDSPKLKSSCLLGWGTCRDCGRGDISSEEDIECFSTIDMAAVGLNLKPIGENESVTFSQTCQLSPK